MGKLNLAPSASVLEVLERALLLVGKARVDLCDARCAKKKVVVEGFNATHMQTHAVSMYGHARRGWTSRGDFISVLNLLL